MIFTFSLPPFCLNKHFWQRWQMGKNQVWFSAEIGKVQPECPHDTLELWMTDWP